MGLRNGDEWFKPKQILNFFKSLRVPKPSNIYQSLSDLASKSLIVKSDDGMWSLTPQGKVHVNELLGELDIAKLEIEFQNITGSEFGHAHHTVIPPMFAPLKWKDNIKTFLDEFPFEKNVFLMTRFPSDKKEDNVEDPIKDVIKTIKKSLMHHGLTLHLASDRQIDDDLLGNAAAHMWVCKFGIGILEDRFGRGLNLNVLTEIGAMLMTGRRCALFKDITAPKLPSDIGGLIYKPLDISDMSDVEKKSHLWAAEDLRLGKCNECKKYSA